MKISLKALNIVFALMIAASFALIGCDSSDDDESLQTNKVDEAATATINVADGGSLEGTYAEGDIVEVAADANISLDGTVVFEKGSLLRILSGVTVESDASSAGLDTLIIKQGAKISCQGTVDAPITFTSGEATPATGDWGGIVINGYAKINQGNGTAYGEGNSGLYGGNNDTDSSGTLNYIKVYYAGYAFSSTNELNGIAMQGVGSGTTVDYVETAEGADDGIEMFGGKVNIKHIISYANEDDQIDCTFGWRGKVQFAIAYTTDGDAALEHDNNEDNYYAEPYTSVQYSNLTVLTSSTKKGARMRRGTQVAFTNCFFANLDNALDTTCMSEDAPSSVTLNTCVFDNAATTGYETKDNGDGAGTFTASGITSQTSLTYALGDFTTIEAADFALTSAPAGTTPPSDSFFDATATFVGAIGSTNWLTTWAF